MAKKKLESFSRGMKSGAVKRAMDKAVSPVTQPVAEAINAKLAELHPNMHLTAPMIETLIQSAIIIGLAEIVDMAGPALGGKLPIDGNRIAVISEFMREYAGEKFGNEIVDSAVKFAPVVLNAFSQFSVEEIQQALPEGKRALPETTVSGEEQCVVPKLTDDEEDNGEEEALQEKVPVMAAPIPTPVPVPKTSKIKKVVKL